MKQALILYNENIKYTFMQLKETVNKNCNKYSKEKGIQDKCQS